MVNAIGRFKDDLEIRETRSLRDVENPLLENTCNGRNRPHFLRKRRINRNDRAQPGKGLGAKELRHNIDLVVRSALGEG